MRYNFAGGAVRAVSWTRGPGAGQAMGAVLTAGSAGLDPLEVDPASVVSKWAGETERHLGKIVVAALGAFIVMPFDEGDAPFTGRPEVRRACDRFVSRGESFLPRRAG